MVRKFNTLCSPILTTEESPLQLSQKSVLVMGRAKYDAQGDLHTACKFFGMHTCDAKFVFQSCSFRSNSFYVKCDVPEYFALH